MYVTVFYWSGFDANIPKRGGWGWGGASLGCPETVFGSEIRLLEHILAEDNL